MKPQAMETRSIVPSVSLLINISATGAADQAVFQQSGFVRLLSNFNLPVTWAIREPRQAEGLVGSQASNDGTRAGN